MDSPQPPKPKIETVPPIDPRFCTREMEFSRERLLDLTLRNKLLNFSPADPEHRDDGRAHKYLLVQGKLKAVWARLMDEEKDLRVRLFDKASIQDALAKETDTLKRPENRARAESIRAKIAELKAQLQEVENAETEGQVWAEKLTPEAFQKRLKRLREESKTLEDTTGDSAFFLACAFLRWRESKARGVGQAAGSPQYHFAPLVLIKISLKEDGRGLPGKRQFKLSAEDAPQDNESLRAKLKKDHDFTLPRLAPDAKITDYLAQVRRSITQARLEDFDVHETLALGFFNFTRYRLWLDLDPAQWIAAGADHSPETHPIVRSLLALEPLDRSGPREINASRDPGVAQEVARHQETDDIPLVKDADSTQYAALLQANQGKSIVVIGPPGSGKSQTITNLIATTLAAGKTVLFAAQKLPALDVVSSRIGDAGLGDFCLRFYSHKQEGATSATDRKPVTPNEIHRQLEAAREALGVRSRPLAAERPAAGLAKKLNAHVALLQGEHAGFGETLQHILCSAAKLREDAEIAWGAVWHATLLVVTLPEPAALTLDWKETRSRTIIEIARLRHEAGDFWQGWVPRKFTRLDLPLIEQSLTRHRRALRALLDWCAVISPALTTWPCEQLDAFARSVRRITLPSSEQDAFVRIVCASPDAMQRAHELERELIVAEESLARGLTCLTLLPEGAAHTASFALAQLSALDCLLEPKASYAEAANGLTQISELIGLTDGLLASLAQAPDGIRAFLSEVESQLDPAIPADIALVTALARQPDGTFPRAPTALLPGLARLLLRDSTVSDEGMLIADQVDTLFAAQKATRQLFAHTLRAERGASDALVIALRETELVGLADLIVTESAAAIAACDMLAETSTDLLALSTDFLEIAALSGKELTQAHVKTFARAADQLPPADLLPPPETDVRLLHAWARGIISADDARGAAAAHERAANLERKIAGLIAHTPPTEGTGLALQNAGEVAESWGLAPAPVSIFGHVPALLNALERAGLALPVALRPFTSGLEGDTFADLATALRLQTLLGVAPSGLQSCQAALLADAEKTTPLALEARRLCAARNALVTTQVAISLGSAAENLRTYIQAVESAESAAPALPGFRLPGTLREIRAFLSALQELRVMPVLPVGCDPVRLVEPAAVATVLPLVEKADSLLLRIGRLPAGCDYAALPSAAEAKTHALAARELAASPLRWFSARWRDANAALKRFAPGLKPTDALLAYETACAIKADEELFQSQAAGAAMLNAYFQGIKTEWTPFVAFARWAQTLTRALDAYARPEVVVAAWQNSADSFAGIAHVGRQIETTAKICRSGLVDVESDLGSPFQSDMPLRESKARAQALLDQIVARLNSPLLGFSDSDPRGAAVLDAGRASTAPVGNLLALSLLAPLAQIEDALCAQAAKARTIFGDAFVGKPSDWNWLEEFLAWMDRLRAEPAFFGRVPALLTALVDDADLATRLATDARAATTAANELRSLLADARVRPEPGASIARFVGRMRSEFAILQVGVEALGGRHGATVADLRQAASWISELHQETARSTHLRQAVAPGAAPSGATVEISLGWALRLASVGLPATLIAHLAEHPTLTEAMHSLLQSSQRHRAALDAIRAAGLVRGDWQPPTAGLEASLAHATRLGATLRQAQVIAGECGTAAGCTLAQLRDGLAAALRTVSLQASVPAWSERLAGDPFTAQNPGEAIRTTIFWIENLQSDRIPSAVLSWALAEVPDARVQAWAQLLRSAKLWRVGRSAIRSAALPEVTDSAPLSVWRAELSATHAMLKGAVEQLSRVVHASKASLDRLRSAALALRQSAEAEARACDVRQRIGDSATTLLTAAATSEHRQFASLVADLPVEVSGWALAAGSRKIVAHLSSLSPLITQVTGSWADLEKTLRSFGPVAAAGPGRMLDRDLGIASALDAGEAATAHTPDLLAWTALQREIEAAVTLGLEELATEIVRHRAPPEQAAVAFEAALAWQKAQVVWRENPRLERFRSSQHEDLRREFATEDASAIRDQNRKRITAALRGRDGGISPSWGNGHADQVLVEQSGRRRKLMPVRKLVEMSGKRMQELCPCWFATPAAIAQFMAPGSVRFDLVIMDEASQLTPEDSWGAITRGGQVVIVGDPLQMPPSNFFGTVSNDDEDDLEADGSTPEASSPLTAPPPAHTLRGYQQESILKVAQATLPQVWLSWHYRSLHQNLIAPANHLSYGRRLVLFPSAHVSHAHLGIQHHYVVDGQATTGQVKNVNEARDVIDRLASLAAEFAQPKHRRIKHAPKSIGIIAMNNHQQEVIKDLIDQRRQIDFSFDQHLSSLEDHETEPFFVRNLENVQGDERDIILLSLTYGPNAPGGTPKQHFGPIGKEGGERRFNVLITRAKWQMAVFSSLRSTHLTSSQVGVQHMRAFLEYCETGRLIETGAASERWFDSPFEAHVHAVLEAKGYAVEKQIGVAGYFVDLAIKDPLAPHRYVLGIECDGASYHSSRSARDRDRLREQVLSERGWTLHRIWSTDWFSSHAATRRALFQAVEAALARAK